MTIPTFVKDQVLTAEELNDAFGETTASIQAETARAQTAEGILQDEIDAETSRAEAAESALAGGISTNASAISAETTRALAAEALLMPIATLAANTGLALSGTSNGNNAQVELNLKPQSVNDATAARALNAAPNYPLILIKSVDGGLFYRDSTDTTSAEDGGTYCGTIIRPTDYATNGVYKRRDVGVLQAAWWGVVANVDRTTQLQLAINVASASSSELWFSAGTFIIDPTINSAAYPTSSKYGLSLLSNLHLRGHGDVILKIKDNSSTDASPLRFTMFFSATNLSNISFDGITFDGNWTNNHISPSRGSNVYNVYNQAFIGFFGNTAWGDNVRVSNCLFKNNAGANNVICAVTNGISANTLGNGWLFTNNTHLDGGMDTSDFTAIFGYANSVQCFGSRFYQTNAPTAFNGTGARNAFEVHGSGAQFNDNKVDKYFGGVIVNSNWTSPVVGVEVCDNEFTNMFLYGVRLWRQDSAGTPQSAINDVRITNNIVTLSPDLYATATTYKAGIIALGANYAYSISDVVISDNTVVQLSGAQNLSAGIYLSGYTITAQKHERYEISRNRIYGTYNGINIFTASGGVGTTFGTITVRGNTVNDLLNVGANVNPIAYFFRGTAGLQIDNLIFENNTAEDDSSGSGQTKFGLWVQDSITQVTFSRNNFINVTTPYTESSLVVTTRNGDDLRQTMTAATGVVVSGWNLTTRKTYKIQLSYTAFTAAALTSDLNFFVVPARSRLVSVIADVTTKFIGGTVATLMMRLGTSAGGQQYLLDFDAFTNPITKGLLDADLGASITRAAAVQGGALASWTANTNLFMRLTSTVGNVNTLTQGVVTLYLTFETYP